MLFKVFTSVFIVAMILVLVLVIKGYFDSVKRREERSKALARFAREKEQERERDGLK